MQPGLGMSPPILKQQPGHRLENMTYEKFVIFGKIAPHKWQFGSFTSNFSTQCWVLKYHQLNICIFHHFAPPEFNAQKCHFFTAFIMFLFYCETNCVTFCFPRGGFFPFDYVVHKPGCTGYSGLPPQNSYDAVCCLALKLVPFLCCGRESENILLFYVTHWAVFVFLRV